ncbi:creatininase family protein [Gaiella occulta]|uniref:creatininase family protein n=1 Tax=Gaiella occulta TaxID=1002870 RepID=UPI0015F107FF|nr:creatininase family protein [Gaiella occulta]
MSKLEDLSTNEVEQIAHRGRVILLLPVGSTEQHGPHLPLATDTILAETYADRFATAYRQDFDWFVLPSIAYGYCPEHSGFSGTVGVAGTDLLQTVVAVCQSASASCAATGVVIVNGHGGNRPILEIACRTLADQNDVRTLVVHPSALAAVTGQPGIPEVHGGRSETSVMLATRPDLVYLDRWGKDDQLDIDAEFIRKFVTNRGIDAPWLTHDPRVGRSGVIGDPTGADADIGRSILTAAVNSFRAVVDWFS